MAVKTSNFAYTVIFLLDGSEAWSLTLKEVHRLGAFWKKVLKKIFEPKQKEVVEERVEKVT